MAMLLQSSRSLTDDELLKYTGQTSVRDAQTAARLVAEAEETARLASALVRRHRLSLPACFLRYWTTAVTTESDHADAVILGAILAFPLALLVIVIFRPRFPVGLAVCGAIASLLYSLFYTALKTKPDEQGKDRCAVRKEKIWSFARDDKLLAARRRVALEDLRQKRWLFAQLGSAARRAEEMSALLATNLLALSGLQFEEFLEQVFNVLGYPEVVWTKASGEQGIDLIIGDGKHRVAVQAKLYQSPVGNEAVQQAFAGMRHYRCDRCAVVKNSVFTRAAVELAGSTDCKLVDGHRLRRIITGNELL
jgi:HJR/Mrr/RecB family endonuclease